MRHAARARGLWAEALNLVLLVCLEVTLKPVPVRRIIFGAFPSENVAGHAVKEPAVVSNYNSTAGELQERVF